MVICTCKPILIVSHCNWITGSARAEAVWRCKLASKWLYLGTLWNIFARLHSNRVDGGSARDKSNWLIQIVWEIVSIVSNASGDNCDNVNEIMSPTGSHSNGNVGVGYMISYFWLFYMVLALIRVACVLNHIDCWNRSGINVVVLMVRCFWMAQLVLEFVVLIHKIAQFIGSNGNRISWCIV